MAFALLLAVTLSSCSNRPTPSSGSDQPVDSPGWKPQTIYEPLPPDRPVPGLDDAKVQEALAGESKPNIVLMMTDNVGWGEIGTYGGGILRGAEEGAWVMPPIFTRRIAFEASLQAEPPIPLGTPDPYVPSRRKGDRVGHHPAFPTPAYAAIQGSNECNNDPRCARRAPPPNRMRK